MAPAGDGETTVNVGVAAYGGQTAVGLSFARQVGNTTFNGGLGAGSGKRHLVRVGAGWRF
ncbi:YadA-like family protein [Hydrogenophaga taeniospiralis]